jgi:DeoR/GlpR family transcriptional regulator of sugar metabolism
VLIQESVYDYLERHDRATVAEVCAALPFAHDSIRRALWALRAKGTVVIVYGLAPAAQRATDNRGRPRKSPATIAADTAYR